MNIKDYKEKYPDAEKSELAVTTELLKTNNFYTGNGLREYVCKLFPGSCILDCCLSGKKIIVITSEIAHAEEQRQLSMIPGTKVKMQERSAEFKDNTEYQNKVWMVTTGPQWMCGSWVV